MEFELFLNFEPCNLNFNRKLPIIITLLLFLIALLANYSLYDDKINSFLGRIGNNIADRMDNEGITARLEQRVIEEESAVIDVVDEASPSVVSILRRQVLFDFFSGREVVDESGIGTGFIVASDGVIITNKHVVSDTDASYSILLKDERSFNVEAIYPDAANDIAILKVSASDLPALELGDSDNLKVGQTVIAIGNALGRFTNTVTKGVVSGIGRGITASSGASGGSEMLENIIQTDAAINPGNSGGPLLNLSGQVIGVNVAMAQGAENIGFSLPVNLIKPILQNFTENGKIVRPYFGILYRSAYRRVGGSRLDLVYFVEQIMEDSPAENSGLKVGDAILKINGKDVSETVDPAAEIAKMQVGEEITLLIDRNGSEMEIKGLLEESK